MLITNIQSLFQTINPTTALKGEKLSTLERIENAWLLVEGGIIQDFGKMSSCPKATADVIDATGRMILPTWCDSHTHLVFATSREEEFEMRLKGKSYEEIALAGGGILNSAKKLQQTSEDDLFTAAWQRLHEVMKMGTGAIEIKSGYGLTLESELKMLRVIKRLKEKSPIPIKASFLGAHSYPTEYKENHQGYINLIVEEMLPQIAAEGLADYIDAFCEKVAFSVEETEQILKAGSKYGLKPKVHTNQFNCMGGIELSLKYNALSVDHLEVVNDGEISQLRQANTIATLLPSAPFFLSDPYQPGRKLVDAELPIALASDYNPGSSPSGNMNFVVSLACVKLKMTPEEAINAATINGAFAMELENEVGSITKGKRANFILTKPLTSVAFIPYSFGQSAIDSVFINGKRIE